MRIPEIIAHRGTPRECRENTLASFERALAQMADGIELDVHLTRDNVVVVHHDATVLAERDAPGRALSAFTAAELRAIPLPSGETIPTLDEVLQLVAGHATVYIEAKARGMEDALVRCLRSWPDSRLAVHSFDHRIPIGVRMRLPGLAIGLLSASYPLDIAALLNGTRIDALWQSADLIDRALVQRVHALGARVIAWTENDPEHADHLARLGVDALCTDTPGALRHALGG